MNDLSFKSIFRAGPTFSINLIIAELWDEGGTVGQICCPERICGGQSVVIPWEVRKPATPTTALLGRGGGRSRAESALYLFDDDQARDKVSVKRIVYRLLGELKMTWNPVASDPLSAIISVTKGSKNEANM